MENIKLYEIYFNKIKKPEFVDFVIYYMYKLNDAKPFKDKLYKWIYKLECKKYGNMPLSDKLIETMDCDFIAQTVNGYNTCNKIHRTIPYDVYKVKLENGRYILCADTHMLYADVNKGLQGWRFANEVKADDFLYTVDGWKKILSVKKENYKMFMCDISMK